MFRGKGLISRYLDVVDQSERAFLNVEGNIDVRFTVDYLGRYLDLLISSIVVQGLDVVPALFQQFLVRLPWLQRCDFFTVT